MADDKPTHDPLHDLYFFIAILVVLVILWFAAGGPSRSDLRGIFLHAPAPLGQDGAYGPNPQPDSSYHNDTVSAPGSVDQYQY